MSSTIGLDPPFTVTDGNLVRLRRFKGQFQAQDTWCWAATVASIHRYMMDYKADKSKICIPSKSQCYLVRQQHGGRACRFDRHELGNETFDCHESRCSIRDQVETGFPEDALKDPYLECHQDTLEKPVGFSTIRQEIDQGHPLVIRLERAEDTHHIVAIIGYDPATPGVLIWDPAVGELRISLNSLQPRLGRWTHTVLTKFYTDPL